MWPFTTQRPANAVRGMVYLPSGTRLDDAEMTEDWTSAGVRSEKIRMLFRPRKPARLYRFNRDGLPAAKAESLYLFNTPDEMPDRDLRVVIHIDAAYESAKAGRNDGESEYALNTQQMQRILLVSALLWLAACGAARLFGFDLG